MPYVVTLRRKNSAPPIESALILGPDTPQLGNKIDVRIGDEVIHAIVVGVRRHQAAGGTGLDQVEAYEL